MLKISKEMQENKEYWHKHNDDQMALVYKKTGKKILVYTYFRYAKPSDIIIYSFKEWDNNIIKGAIL